MKKLFTGILMSAGMLLLAGCGNKITLLSDTFTFELGQNISADAAYFVEGSEKALENTVITIDGLSASGDASGDASADADITIYQADEVGTYQGTATINDQVLKFDVVVEDTIAPEAQLVENTVYMEPNKEYCIDDILQLLSDASGKVKITVQDHESAAPDQEEETDNFATIEHNKIYVKYEETGAYDNVITLTDESGNQTELPVHIVVANAPTLEGVEDIYTTIGETIDYMDGVTATDETDGDITDQVTVDSSKVDTSKEGEYTATYTVTNSIGFTVTQTVNVYVMEEEVLQEKVTSGTVTSSNGRITTTTDDSGKQTVYNAHTDSGTEASETTESSETTTTTEPEKTLTRAEDDSISIILMSWYIGEISDSEAIAQANAAVPRYSWNVYRGSSSESSQIWVNYRNNGYVTSGCLGPDETYGLGFLYASK